MRASDFAGLMWRRAGWAVACSIIGCGAAWLLPPAAAANLICSTGAQTFTSVNGPQCYTVPAGVTTVQALVVGAPGGSGGQNVGASTIPGGAGANGAEVTGNLIVTPGETLYVQVGGAGGDVGNTGDSGGAGGFNGGGAGGNTGAGGGGGASDVRTIGTGANLCTAGASLSSRLIVAAGGGGGGAASGSNGSPGGGANFDGTGANGSSAGGPPGGGGATDAAPGSANGGGGSPGNSDCGGGGQSGNPDYGSGGGGGGGYFGGGGGGFTLGEGGGGGGGGSSFVSTSVVNPVIAPDSTGTPEIVLTPLVPALSVLPAAGVTFPSTQPQGTLSGPQQVTITNNGSGPAQISRLTFTGTDAGDFVITADGCLGQIAAGASCSLAVSFAPQAQGPRGATLDIQSNDPNGPAELAVSGTGGQLPQGPAGPAGQQGPQGPQGPAGKVELITCRTVSKTVKRNGRKVTVKHLMCSGRLVTGTVKVTVPSIAARATITRGRAVYATGARVSTGPGRSQLLVTDVRALRHGYYTLTLRTRDGHRSITRRTRIMLT